MVLGGVLPGRVIEAVPRQDAVVARYAKDLPAAWGERLEGVRTRLATTDRVLALTLDACGGEYDEELVAFLIRERIPATLFLTGRWIDRHPREAAALAQNPLFEIANHGNNHRPASVTGRRAYGIAGTKSPREFAEELLIGDAKLRALGVPAPRYYRSGTNFYDDVALAMASFNNPRIMRDLPRLLPQLGLRMKAAWGDAVAEGREAVDFDAACFGMALRAG